jgi:hypothetical protein
MIYLRHMLVWTALFMIGLYFALPLLNQQAPHEELSYSDFVVKV